MFNLKNVHPSWQPIITKGLAMMDPIYLKNLNEKSVWLPGPNLIFNAFSEPLQSTKYILWGESPYPRTHSANGYAFWDNAVTDIWSEFGLSKSINRATSLRNFIKMLLVARGNLGLSSKQANIATIDKQGLVTQLSELFANLLHEGFLLLNASLVLSKLPVSQEAKYWQPFIVVILEEFAATKQLIQLILLGNIAKSIEKLAAPFGFPQFTAEHPYNISFIQNPKVIQFFQLFDLLKKRDNPVCIHHI